MGDENPICTLGDYFKLSHEGYRNTIELPVGNNVDLALYDNESWNDPRDFSKPVKAIAFPQDVPSTSDHRLIELENQVQHLMEVHLAPTQPTQVNKITTSCEICSGPHDTQYCMEDPKQAFVEYTSSYTDEAGGLVSNFMASQDTRLSKFEADFKQQQSEMTNKIDTVLKAITDRITGTLPSDTVKNLKLSTYPVLSARSYPTEDPQCSTQTHSSINAITIHAEQQSTSYDDGEKENKEEVDDPENIHVNPPTPPDPSVTFITEKVLKFNSFFESLGLVPPSSNTELICTKEEDGDVMFIEIVPKDDNSRKEEPEAGEQEVKYFDIFLTRSELQLPNHIKIRKKTSYFRKLKILAPSSNGDKERRSAMSISKLKATYYPDFGLEELTPSLWIKSEHDYDISATYGISHWWFKRKEFYITRHIAPSDRCIVRSHMKLLSVIRNIVIRHHVEDLQLGIESYQTRLNLTQPSWDASNFLFKEDYTIVHKPRAIIYRDRNNQKKIMRENEVHRFSNATLTRILEQLDHMVKEFVLFMFNPSMEHRIWSEDDKRRSKEFIEVIERRLKIRRIFRNLESFVSGCVRDVDYRLIQRTE
ncbi:hypothetical protein Tco_0390294 [Tanacetum coccineum]